MRIAGLQKLTLLDFPGKTAATIFTPGCNFRCPFCHNAGLVLGNGARSEDKIQPIAQEESGSTPPFSAVVGDFSATEDPFDEIPLDSLLSFLKKRSGLLDGICITGGEPLMQANLIDFCSHVKELGYAIKLDTNGSLPSNLKTLLDAQLIDYVAMDVKSAPSNYAEVVGLPHFDSRTVSASLDVLRHSGISFELRTTVVRELHSADILIELAHWIESAPAWYLQSYVDSPQVLAGAGSLHAWSSRDLHNVLPTLQTVIPHTYLRGIA